MKSACCLLFCLSLALTGSAASGEKADFIESFDSLYNNLTVERRGSIVELRARSRRGEFLESAVDLSDPLKLVVPYTRSLYAALFFHPEPKRVLMIGLGGAGFHRLFAEAYPDALLHSVELDPKVFELAKTHMNFKPTGNTPVTLMDGRQFIKRTPEKWDWIILDAFRGGYVPPHLKTQDFYRECAGRLNEDGVFVSNLHTGTELFYADIKTIGSIFPQLVLFQTTGRGNVIVCAVKYREPLVTDPSAWPPASGLDRPLKGYLDMDAIRRERMEIPRKEISRARLLTDDFAPVEFLDTIKRNNKD